MDLNPIILVVSNLSPVFLSLISSFLLFFLFKVWHIPHSKTTLPTDWPVLGMLPGVIHNLNHILLWITSIQLEANGSYMMRGPWFSKIEVFCTADPANLEYIMSKRYHDFHKGSHFNRIFDFFGDGIFNTDGYLWKYQRRIAHATFSNPCFWKFVTETTKDKMENGFIPLLDRTFKEGLIVDLQDLFTRFTCDVTFITLMGHDPGSLSIDLPSNLVSKFIHDRQETPLMRHVLPLSFWKLQQWLGIGKEGSLKRSTKAADLVFYKCIARKREEVKNMKKEMNSEEENKRIEPSIGSDDHHGKDLLTVYIMENYGTPEHGFQSTTKFLRDTLVTLLGAGQATTSAALTWFFWLLSKNPEVEAKIKQELHGNFDTKAFKGNDITYGFPTENAIKKLVYLHGAICESLRLFPPIPMNHKASHQPVTLPSGHNVNPWTTIILNCYAMGRMRSIWGEDCLKFKPERWITEQGIIKFEPSHKFFAFNAGPRICLGKDIALMQMKMVICAIFINDFQFQVIEGQIIEPAFSTILTMKHGLEVRIFKENPII